jgi:hypothetical protein
MMKLVSERAVSTAQAARDLDMCSSASSVSSMENRNPNLELGRFRGAGHNQSVSGASENG